MKKHLFLFLIILLAALLRLWNLGIIPFGVTHDEMGYIYNAYSIALTGKNVFGQPFPFLTWMVQGGFPFMPVPIYLAAPLFWFLPLSATTGRLLASCLGIVDVLLLYILIVQLFKNRKLALISALFLGISPWHIHFSRSAYDPNYSLFFYLLGIVLFLWQISKKQIPIFSFFAFLLAIFSYRGMSVIAIPLFVLLFLFAKISKSSKRQLITTVAGFLVIISIFIGVIKLYGKNYTQEALFFQDPAIQQAVDDQSRSAQGPLWLKRIFLNKPMNIAAQLRANYIKSYSPEFLFLYTEPNKIYSIWSRGRIYFIDIIFIFFGLFYIFKKDKNSASFVIGLLLIGGLPGAVGGLPYSARNLFLSVIFPIITAAGILQILDITKNKLIRQFFTTIIIVAYIFSLSSYLFDYYYRYAYETSEAWAKSIKDVSIYVHSQKKNYEKIYVYQTSFGDMVQYAFWNKLSPSTIQEIWNKRTNNPTQTFSVENVSYISGCPETFLPLQKSSLIIVHDNCKVPGKLTAVIRDYPGNIVWNIYSIMQ